MGTTDLVPFILVLGVVLCFLVINKRLSEPADGIKAFLVAHPEMITVTLKSQILQAIKSNIAASGEFPV